MRAERLMRDLVRPLVGCHSTRGSWNWTPLPERSSRIAGTYMGLRIPRFVWVKSTAPTGRDRFPVDGLTRAEQARVGGKQDYLSQVAQMRCRCAAQVVAGVSARSEGSRSFRRGVRPSKCAVRATSYK